MYLCLARKLIPLSFVSLSLFLLPVKAQKIEPEVLPEPTTIYTCDENYQPTDLTFDGETLHSVSSFYDLMLEESFQFESMPKMELENEAFAKHNGVKLCNQTANSPILRPFSITKTPVGLICTNYHMYGPTPEDSVNLSSFLYCVQKGQLPIYLYPHENGHSNANGLASSSEGIWILNWYTQPSNDGNGEVAGKISLISYNDITKSFEEDKPQQPDPIKPLKTFTIDKAPYFIDINPQDNSLFITTFTYPRNQDSYNERLIRIDEQGAVSTIKDGFQLPSGVLVQSDTVWVADAETGELFRLAIEGGRVLSHYTGLQGPMGMDFSPDGDLCIAEMRGGRISCYSLASLDLQ